ncbi:transglycosylase domain-containing protein [Gramella sp. GC03-9]|uniref:Transglycosylase domain-containing protein n=1 Tax=Christiangramia oceanisediminis TaxID=2920386 RepID=A0A9X2KY06_9FLAO|nr:transglycosylase domain-containing protein [Gramella oceanisediminis]MCP9200370.1 transglycosylase domain-containing protein [Gramella oceanisediminis]
MLSKIKRHPKLKWTLIIVLSGIALFFLFFGSIYFGMWGKIPSSSELSQLNQNKATQVLASNGELIGKFYVYDRQPIDFSEFPPHLIEALIATEDARFYEHDGIDNRSLLRVFFKSILLQDESAGGGSTITLQLAKNLYGRRDFGMFGIVINKMQEAIIAKRLEDIYSKNDILELYLNTVPFSDNTYGIESASLKFFNKNTSELNLEESAVLIGMLKASHYYNPRIFPERSRLRRDVVLMQMAKYDYLTQAEAEEAKMLPLLLDYKSYSHDEGIAPYFREQVRKDVTGILDTLKNKDGKKFNIYRDGLIVHTTLDFKMQQLAEEAMREHMAELQVQHEKSYGNYAPWIRNKEILNDALKKTESYQKLQKQGLNESEIRTRLEEKHPTEVFEYDGIKTKNISTIDSLVHYLKFVNSGLLAVEPQTGSVKAWVGGVDFRFFKYDHVSQSKRQVGSTFKPIVYTAALESGMDPCSYFSVREVTYEDGWTPSNSSSEGDDPHMNYNLKTALSKSMNTIAVKVLMETGIGNVIEQARRMGIESKLPAVPSIALGTASLSLSELTSAYTSYVNEGYTSKPFYITHIQDANGNTLAKFEPKISANKAFSDETRKIMINMMEATVNEGTASRLRYSYGLQNDIAGKTGTTQDNKDGWFVGITPNLVCLTWVGADDHRIGFKNTAIGQGANTALPIFAKLMQQLNADSEFSKITNARFEPLSPSLRDMMECPPQERDNFLERLFSGKDEKSSEPKKEKKKKGFFKRLFGKKDDN